MARTPDESRLTPVPRPPAGLMEAVRARRGEWISYLSALASLESPTTDPESQQPVQGLLRESLTELGFRVRLLPGRVSGGTLVGIPRDRPGRGSQLLLGHTDTVWPSGTLRSMPVELEGPVLRGPGVFDMKSGLTSIIIALRVLRDLGLEPALAPVVLLNSDEETGSAESTGHIARLARRASRVYVLEPALGPDGRLKTSRKGVGLFRVSIAGRSAHAGLEPAKGASAIEELSRVIARLHGMADPAAGVSVNVGTVRGGVRPNVVAAAACAEVDVRVTSVEQGRRIEREILGLAAVTPGCRLEVRGSIERPPLEQTGRNTRLWKAARRLGASMGLDLGEGMSGGASDGNTTSMTTATLDGLGGVGDGAHAVHEHVDVDRSLERCALLAGLILLPALHSREAPQ